MVNIPDANFVADQVEEWLNEPKQAESFLDEGLIEFIRHLGEWEEN